MATNFGSAAASSGGRTKGFDSPATFDVKATFEFFKYGGSSFRAQIVNINDKPYVGVCRFFLEELTQEWLPTKKNMFMTVNVWLAMLQMAPTITKAAQELASSSSTTSSRMY